MNNINKKGVDQNFHPLVQFWDSCGLKYQKGTWALEKEINFQGTDIFFLSYYWTVLGNHRN